MIVFLFLPKTYFLNLELYIIPFRHKDGKRETLAVHSREINANPARKIIERCRLK